MNEIRDVESKEVTVRFLVTVYVNPELGETPDNVIELLEEAIRDSGIDDAKVEKIVE